MKTRTSITNGLLRSLAIIPVITLLILSCGQEDTEYILDNQKNIAEEQKLILEEQEAILEEQALSPEEAFGENAIIILNNQPKGKVTIDGKEYTYKKEGREYQFYNEEDELFDYKSKGFKVIEITEILEEVTSKDIEDYNQLARKHKAYIEENNAVIVWKDETSRMQTIFNSMTKKQRANNEPWPYIGKHYGMDYEAGQIPPPPPPAPPLPPTDLKEIEN